jgi:hypothetical protein
MRGRRLFNRRFPPILTVLVACLVSVAANLLVSPPVCCLPMGIGHKPWSNSALADDQQKQLEHAQRCMRSGNFTRATAICQQVLSGCGDVPKCLAVATATEAVGLPMLETRRACLDKAISLVQNSDDMILVALKARQYQFFEITRQTVQSLLGKARSLPELYALATRCQEVALNDVAHMAMEKAYTGVKNAQDDLTFLEYCKRMGMEDLQRKAVKDVIDSQTDVRTLCEQMLRMKDGGYSMRDMNRYGLRKCMDDAKTVDEMQSIFEVARQLNEPDFATRAQYFVRKGKIIEQIKSDRANYEAQLRAWREGIDVETARMQDPRLNQDAGKPKAPENGGAGTGF